MWLHWSIIYFFIVVATLLQCYTNVVATLPQHSDVTFIINVVVTLFNVVYNQTKLRFVTTLSQLWALAGCRDHLRNWWPKSVSQHPSNHLVSVLQRVNADYY